MQTGDFGRVGEAYQQYSDGIRGRIRHQLVFEVIADLLPPGGDVLDMGCGDGEIAVRLAEAGFRVRGIDTSPDMLRRANERAATLPKTVQSRLTFSHGDIASFDAGESFDAVCCHGVLMYLDDSVAAIDKLARHVRIGGVLSILSKNALASGFREALRGDYAAARALVETGATTSMGNLGIATRGDDPDAIVEHMEACGLTQCQWRGIRIFSDHLDGTTFNEAKANDLIALERAASTRNPYRAAARLYHATGIRA